MKNINSIILMFSLLAIASVFWSCVSGPPSQQLGSRPQEFAGKQLFKPIDQTLTDYEQDRLNAYRKLESGILVDLHPASINSEPYFIIDHYTQAYEGFRLIQLFGLDTVLTEAEQVAFINGLFSTIPQQLAANGDMLSSIVIPKWYDNGDPLVFSTVKLKAAGYPALVVLFNSLDGVREAGWESRKFFGPTYTYPRMVKTDTGSRMEAKDYYAYLILQDGRVSASGAVGKTLPAFSEMKSVLEKVNLTDSYLRDDDTANDTEVLPILAEVIADPTTPPLSRIHAHLQLFLFYLVSGNIEMAESYAQTIATLPELDLEEVRDTEVAATARQDLAKIVNLAKSLSKTQE